MSNAATLATSTIYVWPAAPRSGWIAGVRRGSIIEHVRLPKSAICEPEAARSEAQALWPDARIVLPGDPKIELVR